MSTSIATRPGTVTREVAAFPLRNINAARRRVALAREKAERFPTVENRLAVTEFEDGLARMEATVTA